MMTADQWRHLRALGLCSLMLLSMLALPVGTLPASAAGNSATPSGWAMFSKDATNSGQSATTGPTANVTEAWNVSMGTVSSAAAVVDGTVYIGSGDANIYALDAETGAEQWRYATGGFVGSAPAVVDGVVYVGSNDGTVYALDAATGAEEWAHTTGGSVRSSPTVADGTVYVGSNDGTVYALNAASGSEEWSVTTGGAVKSTPAVADDTVYVGSNDNTVYALNASTGAERWNVTTGWYVDSSPAVVDGTVYVGSADGNVYALDATTGSESWRHSIGSQITTSPAVHDGTVYIGGPTTDAYALDAATGNRLWRFTTNNVVSSPAVVDGTVYIGSGNSKVYGLKAASGAERWNVSTGSFVSASPAVVNGSVYIGSDRFYALRGDSSSGTTPANFSASIATSNQPVNTSESATLTASIENTGGRTDTQTVTLTVDGIRRDSTAVTLAEGASTSVPLSWATEPDDAGRYPATVATTNDSASTSIVVGDATPEDGGDYFIGQLLATGVFASTDSVHLETGGGTFITDVPVPSDGVTTIDTGSRTEGAYVLTDTSGTSLSFDLIEQSLVVEPNRSVVDDNTTVGFSIRSNRANYHLLVTAAGLDGSSLVDAFDDGRAIDTDDDGTTEGVLIDGATDHTVTADFADVAAGDYTLTFDVPDTTATNSSIVTVDSDEGGSGSSSDGGSTGGGDDDSGAATFGVASKVVQEQRGDVAAIPIEFSGTDEATLEIGSRSLNYRVRVTIEAGDDDLTTVRFNTHRAGRAAVGSGVFTTDGSMDTITEVERIETPALTGGRRLAAEPYPMTLSVDGTETDVGSLSLQDPAVVDRSLELQRARGSLRPGAVPAATTALDGTTVAHGDWVALRIRTAGIYGYIESTDDLAQHNHGVSVRIREPSVEVLGLGDRVRLDTFSFLDGAARNEFRLLADTADPDFEVNATYLVSYSINATANPYIDDSYHTSANFTLRPRAASIEAPTLNGELTVHSTAGQRIAGSTTLPPGTPLNLTVQRSAGARSTSQPISQTRAVTVSPTGTFNATFDFSAAADGQQFTARVRERGVVLDSREGVISRPSSVTMPNQVSANGRVLTVATAYLSDGGYVSIHDPQLFQSGARSASVLGSSKYLGAGQHTDIQVALDQPLRGGTTGIIAMVHRDTNGNAIYDFVTAGGQADGPYTIGGTPVTDSANVTVPTPTTSPPPTTSRTPVTTTRTPTPTPTPTPTSVPTTTTPPTTTTTEDNGETAAESPGFGTGVAGLALVLVVLLALRRP